MRSASGRSDSCQCFRIRKQSIDTVAANPPGMNSSVLVVHLVVGILVAACAALFVWRRLGRRITLYVLTLQILLGIGLMSMHYSVKPEHYGLAVLAWIGYMAANAMGRKPGSERNTMILTIVSSVMVLAAFAIGLHAVGKV